ncbi:MAG: hypothetical protein Q9157_006957 [Trypethelium eluteriae]
MASQVRQQPSATSLSQSATLNDSDVEYFETMAKNGTSGPTRQFRFMDLPLELRMEIYRFVLPKKIGWIRMSWLQQFPGHHASPNLSILRLNRQVYFEAKESLYRHAVYSTVVFSHPSALLQSELWSAEIPGLANSKLRSLRNLRLLLVRSNSQGTTLRWSQDLQHSLRYTIMILKIIPLNTLHVEIGSRIFCCSPGVDHTAAFTKHAMTEILREALTPLKEIRLARMSFSVSFDHFPILPTAGFSTKQGYATSLTESENAAYIEVTEEVTKVVQSNAPILAAPPLFRLMVLFLPFYYHIKQAFSDLGTSRLFAESEEFVKRRRLNGNIAAALLQWGVITAMWDKPEYWDTTRRPFQGPDRTAFEARHAKAEILVKQMEPIVEELRATIKEQEVDRE